MTTPEQLTSLVEEMRTLKDATEELYIFLEYAWRNREEIYEVLESRNTGPKLESVECETCDAEQSSVAAAVTAGWSQFQPAGEENCDFIGKCPGCLAADITTERSESAENYCCDRPNLQWNSDPDLPGIACESCGYIVAENGCLASYEPDRSPKEKQKKLF